jgi:hypothetical protein
MGADDNPTYEAEARWRAATALDILSLDAAAIAAFYAPILQQQAAAQVWTDPMTAALPPDIDQAINEGIAE